MKNRWIKKILAVALSMGMVLGMVPGVGSAPVEVQGAATVRDVNLGTAGFVDPTTSYPLVEMSWEGSKVYYGNKLWWVLDRNRDSNGAEGAAFLFSEKSQGEREYHDGYESITWENCTLRTYLNGAENAGGAGTFLGDAFTSKEQGGIRTTTVVNADNPYYDVSGGNATADKLFLLSYEEARDYEYGLGSDMHIRAIELEWWLRTPGYQVVLRSCVETDGFINSSGRPVYELLSIRPAFNLNLDAVLFSSAPAASKSSFASVGTDQATANIWKLTLKDSDTSFAGVLPSSGQAGTSASVEVTAVGSGSVAYNQTSAMLVDAENNVVAYGSIGDQMAGVKTFAIPSTIPAGIYTLKVFPEQVNGGNLTDYAGRVIEQSITIRGASYTITKGPETNGTFSVDKATATADETVSITPDPAIGYVLGAVSVTDADGNPVATTENAGSYTFTMPAKNVTVNVSFKAKETTPVVGVDFVREKLTGFVAGSHYAIDGNDISPTDGELAVADYIGRKISIVTKAGEGKVDSDPQSLQVPGRPAAPNTPTGVDETVDGKNDGSIAGVDSGKEYSIDQNTWTSCEGESISNLAPGTYYVREKAVEHTAFASDPATIMIAQGVPKKIVLTVTAPVFDAVTEGYPRPEAKGIILANDTEHGANWDATVNRVTLSGADAASFTLSGSENNWTVQPVAGLAANDNGTPRIYTAVIEVTYDATEGITNPATADISFTVNPKSHAVKVIHGTGSATYHKGAAVTATADAAAAGYAFKEWTGLDGLTLLDGTTATSETIKFTMPDRAVELTAYYRDIASPSATIQVKDNTWKQLLRSVTFGHFFKNTQTVTITGTDQESGVKTVEYYLSEKELAKPEEHTEWTDYRNTPFTIDPSRKLVIYAKVTDVEENVIIVNSHGIVVYKDSTADTTKLTHIKGVDGDQAAKVVLNGNTIKDIQEGNKTLTAGTDYVTDQKGTITFKKSYLESLAVKDTAYTLTVSYHPLGEAYVAEGDNEAPANTSLSITVKKAGSNIVTTPTPTVKPTVTAKPTATVKPLTGTNTSTTTNTTRATATQTGDATAIGWLLAVLVLSGGGFAVLTVKKKRKSK